MTIPCRAWEPPQPSIVGFIERGFKFADSVARNPDEFTTRDHHLELLAPVLNQLRRGDIPAAQRTAERLRRQRPSLASIDVEYARLLLADGNPTSAMHVLKQVLERNHQHIDALKLLGFAHLQLGELPQSLAVFIQTLQYAPADSFSQINCHSLRMRLRRNTLPPNTHSNTRPVVATSIPPKGIDVGIKAVQSWQNRGFKVISINTRAERDVIAPHFSNIDFFLCEDTAKPEFGKDYQYLDTLLDALAQTGHSLCGIINADIILRGEPAVWDRLCAVASTHFIYGSRVNVQNPTDRFGTLLEPGFDFFLFPSSFLNRIPRTGFIIGQPAWDIFLPAWIARCNLPFAFCYSPVALHVEHPTQWSRTMNSRFTAMAFSWFAPELAKLMIEDPGCHTYLRIFTGAMSQILNKSAKAKATPLFCTSPQMDQCFAPVDSLYWIRDAEETLLMLY